MLEIWTTMKATMIKKHLHTFKNLVFLMVLALTLGLTQSSCKTGEGCIDEEAVGKELENYNGKRGKSSLFSKKQKKNSRF